MRLIFAGIALIFFLSQGRGQNLIENGGFETFEKCPVNYVTKKQRQLVPHWIVPTGATPDYFNSCTTLQVGVPQNFMGYCLPKDGQAYAGLFLYVGPIADTTKKVNENYREYLESRFIQPLKKDTWYEFKLYYSVAAYSTYAINRFGIVISKQRIGKRRTTALLHFIPQISVDSSEINTNSDEWAELSGRYHASGGERYLTFGNFYDDRHTRLKKLSNPEISAIIKKRIERNRYAYYYIDSVSVTEITGP